jgi:acyl carrier protein
MASVAERVTKVVTDQLGFEDDPSAVFPEARFDEDLGADSLDMVEIEIALEEEFGISLDADAIDRWRTVKDAAEHVGSVLLERAGRL